MLASDVRASEQRKSRSTERLSGPSWTRTQRIRTAARLEVEAALLETLPAPVYQQLAPQATHLRELGMSNKAIAAALSVSDKTIARAIAYAADR